MKLQIKKYNVNDAVFSTETKYLDGILSISLDDLKKFVLKDINSIDIDVNIAKQGEETRIIHVLDTVKAVYKPQGATFPGLIDENEKVGEGITHELNGIAVIQTGLFDGVMEGIIDMYGEGSKYSYFSNTINIVVSMNVLEDISLEQFTQYSKSILLRTSKYLAQATRLVEPSEVQIYEKSIENKGLKKVGYVCYMESLGLLRNVYFYGNDTTDIKPTLVHPNEILDGALVSGDFEIASHKNPTFFHQSNPIIRELYNRDGSDVEFSGVIISTERGVLGIKQDNAKKIANIAESLNLDGVIISKEGGGHADTDIMLCTKELESRGIKTVITLNEIAGKDGDLPSIVSTTEKADAVVTNGNNDEVVKVNSMKVVYGGDKINGKIDAKNEFETSLGLIYCSTNQLGFNKMSMKEY